MWLSKLIQVFNLAHQGIYLVLLIFELLSQLIFPCGWYCGCCHLGFWMTCFGLTHLVLILSLAAFFKEMHVFNVRICKTVFHTVLDTFLTPMEQAILEESLLLWVSEFLWEPIMDLGQKSLHPSCKGRD